VADPLYLVDASVWIFRAWFSVSDAITDPAGRQVNAFYGYANFLLDLLDQDNPRCIVVAFDESLTSSYRNEIYPAYKANRELPPPELERQFDLCRRFTAAMGISELASHRYEADDIIGTLARVHRERGRSCVVVTRDKDLTQVLRPGDEFWDFASRKRIPYEQIAGAFGVLPERMADYLALTGDPVDNIPGVPGVGKKTATALLTEFENLEQLYDDLERVRGLPIRGAARIVEKLAAHRDLAMLARRLTVIADDMPLADVWVERGVQDTVLLDRLLAETGIGGRLRRKLKALDVPPDTL
jgi:5'-3' exonuclease